MVADSHRVKYLRSSVAGRELLCRRAVLGGIGVLTLLGTLPIVGHHVAGGANAIWESADHVGQLCLVGLRALLIPVHQLFHVFLGAGLLYAALDRATAWRRMHRVLVGLDTRRPRPDEPLWLAATGAGLSVEQVWVVAGLPNPAFTAGWFRPQVYVSQSLIRRLSQAELAAVLAHESAHVFRRDPLRLSLFRAFACVLFWIPAIRKLAEDVADEAEVHADDVAARRDPLMLASAILSVASWRVRGARPEAHLSAVGFACRNMVERRVRRLAGEDVAPATHLTRRSLVGAMLVLVLVWASGAAEFSPQGNGKGPSYGAEGGTVMNCAAHVGPALLHVFCPGFALGPLATHCPHYARQMSHGHSTV